MEETPTSQGVGVSLGEDGLMGPQQSAWCLTWMPSSLKEHLGLHMRMQSLWEQKSIQACSLRAL